MFSVSVASFAFAVLLSFCLTYVVRKQAIKFGLVAGADSDRHIHTNPIPRIGGVAIYAGFLLPAIFAIYWLHRVPMHQNFHLRTVVYLVGAATLVFLLGLYDD